MNRRRTKGKTEAPVTPPPPLDDSVRRGLLVLLGATLLLHVVATFFPSLWLWGINLSRYSPRPWALAAFALAAIGFVPPVARRIHGALERLGAAWERAGAPADLAAALACGATLWFLRDSLRFVGDFDLRTVAIDYEKPPTTLFPQASPLDLAMNFVLPRALLAQGIRQDHALQAVGAAMGAVFAFASMRALRAAGARGAALATGALVVLAGAHLQHFAGYDKFGPLLAGLAVAAWGAVRLARERRGAWRLAAGAAMAVLSHRSGYFVLPAALWMLASSARGAPRARRGGIVAAAVALVLIALLPLPAVVGVLRSVDLAAHAPGGAVARSFASPEAPLWLTRIADLLNGLFLMAPLWPLALVAATRRRDATGSRNRSGLLVPLVLAVGAASALLLLVGATRGSGRDWDAATPLGVTVALATAIALIRWWRSSGGLPPAAPTATVALALGLLAWVPHVSQQAGMRRVRELLASHPRWSDAARAHALDFLGLRALVTERHEEAAADFEAAIAVAPNPRYFYQLGLAWQGMGRLAGARRAFERSAELSPANGDPWAGLAEVTLAEGDTARALALADSALRRNPDQAEAVELRQRILAGR